MSLTGASFKKRRGIIGWLIALSDDVASADDQDRPSCRSGRRQRRANLAVLQQAALRHFKSLLEEGGHRQHHLQKLACWLKEARWNDLENTGSFIYLVCSPFHKEMYVGETSRSPWKRWNEHTRAADQCGQGRHGRFSRLASYVAAQGLNHFLCVPLMRAPDDSDQRRALETHITFAINARLNYEVHWRHVPSTVGPQAASQTDEEQLQGHQTRA